MTLIVILALILFFVVAFYVPKSKRKPVNDLWYQKEEFAKILHNVQSAYMFTLSEKQIYDIVSSKTPIFTLYHTIPTDIPHIEDFKSKIRRRSAKILKGFSFQPEEIQQIEYIIMLETAKIDNDIMLAIIERQNQLLPPKMQFLKDSINYDSVCLNFLMDAADILENKALEDAVFDYMIKQGYTTREVVEKAKSNFCKDLME